MTDPALAEHTPEAQRAGAWLARRMLRASATCGGFWPGEMDIESEAREEGIRLVSLEAVAPLVGVRFLSGQVILIDAARAAAVA